MYGPNAKIKPPTVMTAMNDVTWGRDRLLPQISLETLPEEVLSIILKKLDQQDLTSLAQTNHFFHTRACERLYEKIIVVKDHHDGDFLEQSQYSYLEISKLDKFVSWMNAANFSKMKRIIIHSQSNLITYDYCALYQKLFDLWDQVPNHKITFINFDINNIRIKQSINQYVSNRSTHFIEDENINLHQNSKVNNLKNWVIFDFNELFELPYNRNIEDLDIFIEQSVGPNTFPEVIPRALFENLSTVTGLYLDSPTSTTQFLECFKHLKEPIMHKLEKLSITASHSYKDGSCLLYSSLSKVIDVRTLKKLEVKVNCIHHACSCISQFFHELPPNQLRKLSLINYKSSNLKQNLIQFDDLLRSPYFFETISSVESLYININDLIKLDGGNNPKFSIKNLINQTSRLRNLQELVIPDFFNNWLITLGSVLERPTIIGGELPEQENYFDLLLNKCSCERCNQARFKFKKLSNFDSNNNYKHEFKRSNPSSISLMDTALLNTDSFVEFNTSNLHFLNYLIANLKRQFIYINENLYTINSVINSNEKPFIQNKELIPYNRLFLHNCLNHLVGRIKYNNPDLRLINLGGVRVEFDNEQNIKYPYNI